MERRNVVILAPYVNHRDVGESWSNYQWVRGLSVHHNVTLLCQRRRDQEPVAPSLPETRVIEWNDPPLLRKFERFDSMLKPGLAMFYFRARRWLKAARRRGEVMDLVHQLAPLAMRYPCPAVGLGVPYVLGPVGGSLENPAGFEGEMGGSPWFVRLRGVDRLRFAYDPVLRATYSGAACVIGVAPYVRDLLSSVPIRRFELASETGVSRLPQQTDRAGGSGLRLLYVGRVVRTKGVRDAIRALKQIPDPEISLDVVGTGDDLEACRAEAAPLGDRVRFHGRVPREQVDGFYSRANAFVFPSFREPSGNVVLEAMSQGLPLIVADRGGPGHVVDESCGIRVAVGDPEVFAAQIATAILKLRDSELRKNLGQAARTKIEGRHTWGTQIASMCQLYESIIDEKDTRNLAKSAEAEGSGDRIGGRSLDSAHAAAAGVCRA